MTTPLDMLEANVMNLPSADRARILERLIVSLDTTTEIEANWVQEALRRKAAIEAGEEKMLPGHEVMARLEARFG
jgi:putative addiction module component (TIGR02574 family)